jgi:ParB/RepB/Spo0J family partition protein
MNFRQSAPVRLPSIGSREKNNMDINEVRCSDVSSDPRHLGYAASDLEELAQSIRAFGVLRPLLVRLTGRGYEVVHGERRLHAARMAGLEFVPAVVVHDAGNASRLLTAA